MAGYWLKPDTGEGVQVATTHDEWVRDKKNAESLGLPASVYAEIMRHPPTAVDEIRILAVQEGLVRIREHRWHVSIQFAPEPQDDSRRPGSHDAVRTVAHVDHQPNPDVENPLP